MSALNIRLAMRAEGDFWCAYFTKLHTMQGAILLGSIRMSLVTENRDRKAAFMAMMQSAMDDAIKAIGLDPVDWNEPQSAPEHEKAGRA